VEEGNSFEGWIMGARKAGMQDIFPFVKPLTLT